MTRHLPGPHHCVSLGISETLKVFKFLKENCAENGSRINAAELDGLMQQYLMRMSRDMGRYYQSNVKCYSSINPSGSIFNLTRLAEMLLHAWLNDNIATSFRSQVKDGNKNWSFYFAQSLVAFGASQIGTDLSAEIGKRYNTLAFTKSDQISIEECLHDSVIIAALKNFMKKFRPVLTNDEAMDRLAHFTNKTIGERCHSQGPNRLNVTNKDLTLFFKKVLAKI